MIHEKDFVTKEHSEQFIGGCRLQRKDHVFGLRRPILVRWAVMEPWPSSLPSEDACTYCSPPLLPSSSVAVSAFRSWFRRHLLRRLSLQLSKVTHLPSSLFFFLPGSRIYLKWSNLYALIVYHPSHQNLSSMRAENLVCPVFCWIARAQNTTLHIRCSTNTE